MLRFLIASAFVTALLTMPGAAPAQQSASVKTSDLDLSRPEDIARLEGRMIYAVKSVCEDADDIFPDAAKEDSKCDRDTRSIAESQVQASIQNSQRKLAAR